jgi:methionine biosynthesis protein MetW
MSSPQPGKTPGFVRELLGRSDYAIIGEIVEPKTKVLDLGCGNGELLEWLARNKGVDARGVEIEPLKVQRAIARGVSVYQGDIDEGLADYPSQAFDYVILSQTLQETHRPLKVLREMLRVGRRGIVAFPNFGHWSMRLSMLWTGCAPKTKLFPHEWYESPNIHILTVDDFESLAAQEKLVVEKRYFISGHRNISVLPNLRAETAVFLVRRP